MTIQRLASSAAIFAPERDSSSPVRSSVPSVSPLATSCPHIEFTSAALNKLVPMFKIKTCAGIGGNTRQ